MFEKHVHIFIRINVQNSNNIIVVINNKSELEFRVLLNFCGISPLNYVLSFKETFKLMHKNWIC